MAKKQTVSPTWFRESDVVTAGNFDPEYTRLVTYWRRVSPSGKTYQLWRVTFKEVRNPESLIGTSPCRSIKAVYGKTDVAFDIYYYGQRKVLGQAQLDSFFERSEHVPEPSEFKHYFESTKTADRHAFSGMLLGC